MKVLVIAPEKEPVLCSIDGSLKNMQAIVGGFIQAYYPWMEDVAIVCNDEGKINGLPFNRPIFGEHGELLDIIAGTFFICGAPPDSGEFTDIPEDLIEHYMRMFQL